MIDLHSHVLPALDDGAADLDEAVAICEEAAAGGIDDLARWLTIGVPRAILDGTALPPRPGMSPSRRRWFSGSG